MLTSMQSFFAPKTTQRRAREGPASCLDRGKHQAEDDARGGLHRAKLVTPGSEARVARLTALTAAAEKVRSYLRFYANQEQALLALRDEVADLRRPGGIQAA
jgi:hypothetical protein